MVSYGRSGFRFLVLAILVVCLDRTVHAQTPPDPKYLLETGAPTFVTPDPVPAGFINLANGNLHIEIPFVAIPQRGGRPFVAKMVYDSRIWKITDFGYYRQWTATNAGAYGWRFIATGLTSTQYDQVIHNCDEEGNYTWSEFKNYRYSDLDGTVRRFPLYFETSAYCHAAGAVTTTGPSLDATGYVMNSYTGAYPPLPGTPKEVFAPDGTMVYKDYVWFGTTSWKDPNGNFLERIAANDNVIDTLNRTAYSKVIVSSTQMIHSFSSASFNVHYIWIGGISSLGMPGVAEGGFGGYVPQRIEFPDGSKYEFTYESSGTGQLKTMKLPTGETITFNYSVFTDAQGGKNHWVSSVVRGSGTWTYTPTTCGAGWCNQVRVTRPSGDETVHAFSIVGTGAWNFLNWSYHGAASGGNVALTVQHDYDTGLPDPVNGGNAFIRRIRTTTTWPGPAGNLVTKTEGTFDTFTYNYRGTNYTGSRGNVLTSSQFAYGGGAPGGLVRQQVLTYLHDSNASYIPKNIVNRVTNSQTKDAAGVKKTETIATYDSTSLTAVSGITHHD
ncbi:MAG: hypothetical protein ACRD88_12670, partial [Terriglobia bacterium]